MSTIYLDTSILLPIVIEEHENHARCKSLLSDGIQNGVVLTSATHAYAEMYRNLTRGRSPYEVSPALAYQTIVEKLFPLLSLVELTSSDYGSALVRCVQLELSSSIVYDALHYQAALKAGAEILYTNNISDFSRLRMEGDGLEVSGIR